jgi:PAS domain S-box-containing protein
MLTAFVAIKVLALLSYLVLLLLVAMSRAEGRSRAFLAVYLGGMLFWQFASLMANLSDDAAEALLWYNLLIAGSGAFNTLFFPLTRALLGIKKQRAVSVLAYAACAFIFVGGVLGLPWQDAVMGRGGYWVPVYSSVWLLILGPIGFAFWFLGIVNLTRALAKEKSPAQRNRILYVVMGALLVIVGVLTNLTPLRDYPVDIGFNLASAIIIGYAVIRLRLLDIRFVLARSLFYSVLTASLVAVYFGAIFGLEMLLQRSLGYDNWVYGFMAVILLALLFLPVRNLLQRALDRLFFREKVDYQKEIQIFSKAIASAYEQETALALVRAVIQRAVKPVFVRIALSEPAGPPSVTDSPDPGEQRTPGPRLAEWLAREGRPLLRDEAAFDPRTRPLVEEPRGPFDDPGLSLVTPVVLNDRLMATIEMGWKLSGAMYSAEDMRFLTTIANQTAVALEKCSVFRGVRNRLGQQTLLFVLSEKFRGSADFDSVMTSVLGALRTFLDCDACALVYFGKNGNAKPYAQTAIGAKAATIAARWCPLPRSDGGVESGIETARRIAEAGLQSGELSAEEAGILAGLEFCQLEAAGEALGVIILPRDAAGDDAEGGLHKAIASIISQGISLHRTIVNLMDLERYSENVLNSLNDMGDTLLILDSGGSIKVANNAARQILGRGDEDLIGRYAREIAAEGEPLFGNEGWAAFLEKGSISNYELEYRTASGGAVPMLLSGSVMTAEDGSGHEVVVIARDMTEHRKAEEASKNSLLIKEIHHRIKNNLQVVSSLLSLQAGYVSDERTRAMFQESKNRIHSMALIHERLYRSDVPGGVAFPEYLKDLVRDLFQSYGAGRIESFLEVKDIVLDMDTAIPCGLIVSELVTNALKHAFGPDKAGRITVKMSVAPRPADAPEGDDARWYLLTVADDGKGLPEGFDYRSAESLGLRIVGTLAVQLRGKIEVESGAGTEFRILFRELKPSAFSGKS